MREAFGFGPSVTEDSKNKKYFRKAGGAVNESKNHTCLH